MFDDIIERAKALLRSRKQAYETVFTRKDIDVDIVLRDLAKFCRANESTFNPDPQMHALLEGRKEVWLRIQKYVNVPLDDLWDMTRKD